MVRTGPAAGLDLGVRMLHARGRRTTCVVAALTVTALSGCGRSTPVADSPSQNSSPVPGTSHSPDTSRSSIPGGFRSDSTGSPVPSPTASGITTATTHADFAVVDQLTGDHVVASGQGQSLVEIQLSGVGGVSFVGNVGLRRTPAGTTIGYDGPAHRGSSPVRLRLSALMTPDGLGHADIWVDGVHHRLVATTPPRTADPVVGIVVDDFHRGDWADLYDHTVGLPGYSKADFVRLFGQGGEITSLDLRGPTVYEVRYGVAYADAPAHLVATLDGHHLDRGAAVELVWRDGAWRFSSLSRTVHGNSPGA
jgi:hypothetical protein